MAFTLNSPAFARNARIPKQFTRDGDNLSPPMHWEGAPSRARSYALVVEDADAPRGTFHYWAAYDIPADAHNLPQGAGSGELGAAIRMGINDFGNSHYDGPQSPAGRGQHHYHFRLFALDVRELDVPDDCSAEQVLEAAVAHSLAQTEAVGVFGR